MLIYQPQEDQNLLGNIIDLYIIVLFNGRLFLAFIELRSDVSIFLLWVDYAQAKIQLFGTFQGELVSLFL